MVKDEPVTTSALISQEALANAQEVAQRLGISVEDYIARRVERELSTRMAAHMRRVLDGEAR